MTFKPGGKLRAAWLTSSLSTAHSSWIGRRNQRWVARRRDEGHVGLSLAAGLIDSSVYLILRFEKHRPCRVDGHTAIAVIFRQRACFHHDDDWPRMCVPPGISPGLKHQQALQDIARPFYVQVEIVLGAEALRHCNDLQPARLAAGYAQTDKTQSERSERNGPGPLF